MTQFEALTAAAYAQLADAGVEVAVVEAGLGGRWDATNVIDAGIAVLTNVGLEHTRWLGPTVADIAREKLAVVAPGATLVLGADLHPAADAEARVVAERQGATIVRAPAAPPAGLEFAARGAFQRRNFAVACAAAEACLGRLDGGAVRAAAASTVVPGRFEVLADDAPAPARGVEVVLDGAHNAGGIEALAGSLPDFLAGRPLVAVLSVLDDKDAAAMLRTLLPHCAGVVFTANNNPRALSPATLASLAGQIGAGGWDGARVEADPHRAVALARRLAAIHSRPLRARRRRRRGRPRDGLDLPHRRPRASGRRRPGIDAVNREGPSALKLIGAVALLVAVTILFWFGVGYGLGRLFL